jgi:Ras-related protein Rab-1A
MRRHARVAARPCLCVLQVVDTAAGQALAEELGIPFLETSAKCSTNIARAFGALAADIKASIAPLAAAQAAPSAVPVPAAGIRLEGSSCYEGPASDGSTGCC